MPVSADKGTSVFCAIRLFVALGLAAMALAIATPTHAGFVNGDFEDGTFNGWTQGGGTWATPSGGGWNYSPGNPPYQSAIVTPGDDPILAHAGIHVPMVYTGNYAVRVNSEDNRLGGGPGNRHYSTITQTVANWQDAAIYFAWSAVLENPTSPAHASDEQPHFRITLHDDTNNTDLYTQFITADNTPGFSSVFVPSPVGVTWKYSGWQFVQMDTSAVIGHDLSLTLLAADCSLGGHSGAVYLDNIGSEPPPGSEVPEPATMVLMLGGLGALLRRRLRRARSSTAC